MRLQTSKAVIEIIQGDISSQEVDAIVNAANNHLWMGSGVAGAIKRAGGDNIEKEAIGKGPIAVGEAIFTGAGELNVKHVIHAAVMGQDLSTDEEKVRAATRSALRVARELNVESIAVPALGTGVGGFPIERTADIMIQCAIDEIENAMSPIKMMRFVLFGDEALRAFEEKARKLAGGGIEISRTR